jgi:hypothetical protein
MPNNDITFKNKYLIPAASIFYLNQCHLFLSYEHHLKYRTNYKVQDLPVVGQEICCFYITWRFLTMFRKVCHWPLSYIMYLAEPLNFVTERFYCMYALFLVICVHILRVYFEM